MSFPNNIYARFVTVLFFLGVIFVVFSSEAFAETWNTKKSDHFIIQYRDGIETSWASAVLRKAEYYYDRIAQEVGYSRYNKFWTWDKRVQIVVYTDANDFAQHTNQPGWAGGGAIRHRKLSAIITYKHEDGFMDGLLPHEISHLILKDFIGRAQPIPLWFDEGVAQLQEEGKKEKARVFMRYMVKEDKYIPFRSLFNHDIRREKDVNKAALFYIQSVSIVDFLISRYGSENFRELCGFLKEGLSFEQALDKAYASTIDSVDDLQKKWVSYMKF